jgi:hypothetical protein
MVMGFKNFSVHFRLNESELGRKGGRAVTPGCLMAIRVTSDRRALLKYEDCMWMSQHEATSACQGFNVWDAATHIARNQGNVVMIFQVGWVLQLNATQYAAMEGGHKKYRTVMSTMALWKDKKLKAYRERKWKQNENQILTIIGFTRRSVLPNGLPLSHTECVGGGQKTPTMLLPQAQARMKAARLIQSTKTEEV